MNDPTLRAPKPIAERRVIAIAAGLLVFASYAFRLPPLLNARSTNSDAAIVGLQALHVLRGEHAALLWGSDYQTSADAYVAAAFFAVAGATPLALMLSALTLHVVATMLAFATLLRRFDAWTAALLTSPLVLTPSSVHSYALYPPRQLSITLAIAALWATDRVAARSTLRAERWLALGGLFYGLAVSADPYPMVLAPIVLGYGGLVALEAPRSRLPALGIGTLGGLAPFLMLHRGGATGQMGLTAQVIGHNWELLVRECLPWALSYKVYFAYTVMDYGPWQPPAAVAVVQIAGALAVAVIVAFGLAAGLPSRRTPWPTRRLALTGALAYPVVIGAFLCSVMVMDHFSMRYLAALTLMLPFAAIAAAERLGRARFALLLAPHLVAAGLGGWVGYGPFVRGALPVIETPELRDDLAVEDVLRARGITHAIADYWTAYRLTFLWNERIVVVPTNAREDRHAPYRTAFEAAAVFAYLYDPGRSRENLTEVETTLARQNASVERATVGKLTVFVVRR